MAPNDSPACLLAQLAPGAVPPGYSEARRIPYQTRRLDAALAEIDSLRDFLVETRAHYASRMPDEWLQRLAALLEEE